MKEELSIDIIGLAGACSYALDCIEAELSLIHILRAQKEPISKGFFMHIGIDDFGAINSSRGADYGNYILKSVADCMESCLSDNQRLYHLVADQYLSLIHI